jgi:hypothetical protein
MGEGRRVELMNIEIHNMLAGALHEDTETYKARVAEETKLFKARAAKDKRLQKLYGITLEAYSHMLLMQEGVCAICKSAPSTKSLAVDHDHKWKYLKIETIHFNTTYLANIVDQSPSIYRDLRGRGSSKREARARLKSLLKRASVRGLLCFQCNSGLRKYRDNPDFLANAASYLRRHQKGEW